jgi:hypothetical protein
MLTFCILDILIGIKYSDTNSSGHHCVNDARWLQREPVLVTVSSDGRYGCNFLFLLLLFFFEIVFISFFIIDII